MMVPSTNFHTLTSKYTGNKKNCNFMGRVPGYAIYFYTGRRYCSRMDNIFGGCKNLQFNLDRHSYSTSGVKPYHISYTFFHGSILVLIQLSVNRVFLIIFFIKKKKSHVV